ncbi:MAG TPA: PKD domain-containing protein, partial [Trebonia sp.]
ENNVLNAGWSTTANGPTGSAALAADSSSAGTVRADYNGLYARAPSTEYFWAGTAYSRAADFSAATGQGAHDLDLTRQQTAHPPVEGSPTIDSADCAAPGELATDLLGNPHVRDPEVSDTGNGTCHADRGAFERQDAVGANFTVTPSSRQGVAPLNAGVTLTSNPAMSPWGEPVSYTVDFGDGSGPQPVAPDGTVTHTYATPGLYTLTVTAADTGGSTGSSRRQMVVGTKTAPTVTLGAGPDIFNGPGGPLISDGTASFTISAGADAWELASGTISFGDGTSKAMGTFLNWTHMYPHPGTYTATLTETDLLGRLSTAHATVTVGDEFIPTGPYQDYSHSVPAHGTVRLSMAALNAGYSDIRAAYVTITVTGPKKPGSLTVYPNGSAIPKEAAVQFSAGHAASNTALAVPGGQTVDFYNGSGGSVNLTVDTYGLEVTSTPSGGTDGDTYAPDGPVRLLPATTVAGGGHVTLTVAGTHGVPAKADAVVLDVTASGTKAAGYLSAYPDRAADPGIHAADWAAGQMVTGLATVPLQDGKVVLRNGSKGSAVFTADVVGYFNYDGTGSVFLPSAPLRLLDVKIGPRRTTTLRISGKNGLPGTGISAAAVNLTVSGATRSGVVLGWADKTARPNATSLGYVPGITSATAALIPVGADGVIDLYNNGASTVTLAVDLTGAYYRYP